MIRDSARVAARKGTAISQLKAEMDLYLQAVVRLQGSAQAGAHRNAAWYSAGVAVLEVGDVQSMRRQYSFGERVAPRGG